MNRLIKYFYPNKEMNYFDELKTKLFIFQSYLGLFFAGLSILIMDVIFVNENFLLSISSKISLSVILFFCLFILKNRGIRVAGNILSFTGVVILVIWVNILPEGVSLLFKYVQGYYSLLAFLIVGVLYSTRVVLIINSSLIILTTTRIYFFAKDNYPNDIELYKTGYIAYIVALLIILFIIYFTNKFTELTIKKAEDEIVSTDLKNMELVASEEEIRATNEELMATTDALKDSNNELFEAIQRIEESETKFRQLSDLTFEGILTHIKGVVIDANLAFIKMTGYSRDEIIGENIIKLLIPKMYHVEVVANISKNYVPPYEITGIMKNGTTIPIEIESRIIDPNTQTRVIAVRDISERIKHKRELDVARGKADESDRLKAEFLNNMSHEVRTPMNGILGFTQLLDNPDLTEVNRKSYSKIITNSSNQLLSIIDNIIEISKLGTQQVKVTKKEVDINNMLSDLIFAFKNDTLEKNIPILLENKLPDDNNIMVTDEPKLYKILSNLLDNAIKFTNDGSIEVGCKIIPHNSRPNDDLIQFYVKDTGIGIEKDKEELIFNRFSQADPKLSRDYGGLGLGLAIAKENIILLGGNICLESEIGKGSTFYITLPYTTVS